LPPFDWYVREQATNSDLIDINRLAYRDFYDRREKINAAVTRLAAEAGVPILPRRDLVCDDVSETCALVTPGGHKTMYDYGHWTLEGAEYFGRRAAQTGWLDALGKL